MLPVPSASTFLIMISYTQICVLDFGVFSTSSFCMHFVCRLNFAKQWISSVGEVSFPSLKHPNMKLYVFLRKMLKFTVCSIGTEIARDMVFNLFKRFWIDSSGLKSLHMILNLFRPHHSIQEKLVFKIPKTPFPEACKACADEFEHLGCKRAAQEVTGVDGNDMLIKFW